MALGSTGVSQSMVLCFLALIWRETFEYSLSQLQSGGASTFLVLRIQKIMAIHLTQRPARGQGLIPGTCDVALGSLVYAFIFLAALHVLWDLSSLTRD